MMTGNTWRSASAAVLQMALLTPCLGKGTPWPGWAWGSTAGRLGVNDAAIATFRFYCHCPNLVQEAIIVGRGCLERLIL